MMHPVMLELEVQELVREARRRQEAGRLLALARAGQLRAGLGRRLAAFAGRQLVKLGSRLQGAPAPAPAAVVSLDAGATGVALAA